MQDIKILEMLYRVKRYSGETARVDGSLDKLAMGLMFEMSGRNMDAFPLFSVSRTGSLFLDNLNSELLYSGGDDPWSYFRQHAVKRGIWWEVGPVFVSHVRYAVKRLIPLYHELIQAEVLPRNMEEKRNCG